MASPQAQPNQVVQEKPLHPNEDSEISVLDAMRIVPYIVGDITEFS